MSRASLLKQCLLILLFASSLHAQSEFTYSVEVDITNIDVVVTDRSRRAVTGLTAADFEVFENGRPQPITNFLEVRGGVTVEEPVPEAPAPAPAHTSPQRVVPRFIVFFVDQSTLMPHRKDLVKAIRPLVMNARDEDRMMVIAANYGPEVRVPFTNDKQVVMDAIEKAVLQSTGGMRRSSAFSRTKQEMVNLATSRMADRTEAIYAAAKAFASEELRGVRMTVASLETLMASLAGVDGRKAVVFLSEGLPIEPGRAMLEEADSLTKRRRSVSEIPNYRAGDHLQRLADRANQSRVTFYPFHAAGLDSSFEMTEMSGEGIFVGATTRSGPSSDRWGSFQLLASETGGVVSVNTNNFARAFSILDQDLATYYSLGYRSPAGTAAQRSQRKIEVRVKRPGMVVRTRKSFSRRDNDEKGRDAVLASLLTTTSPNDLGIEVFVGDPGSRRRKKLVPIEVKIPISNLTLFPTGDQHVGGFTVLVAAEDQKKRVSDVTRKKVDIKVPQSDIASLSGKHFTYTVELAMGAGDYELAVGVVDRNSGVAGYVKQEIHLTR